MPASHNSTLVKLCGCPPVIHGCTGGSDCCNTQFSMCLHNSSNAHRTAPHPGKATVSAAGCCSCVEFSLQLRHTADRQCTARNSCDASNPSTCSERGAGQMRTSSVQAVGGGLGCRPADHHMKRAMLPSGQEKGRARNIQAVPASTTDQATARATARCVLGGRMCSASSTNGVVKYLRINAGCWSGRLLAREAWKALRPHTAIRASGRKPPPTALKDRCPSTATLIAQPDFE